MKKFITIDRTKTIATEMIASVITKELNVDESSLEITLINGKVFIVTEESLFIDEMFWLINKDIESNDYSGLAEQMYEMNYGERTKENTATENSDVRYCHMCGASAKKHHTFCIKCGTKLINRNIR